MKKSPSFGLPAVSPALPRHLPALLCTTRPVNTESIIDSRSSFERVRRLTMILLALEYRPKFEQCLGPSPVHFR